ncbi:AraC family transcriptional regulator [uncultured Psychroserpens sp.]|uniref:helix-turn-helix domain-containing protein n=1 Tax=uncultured Psychroserpens sp. TaxID=255436 RepID=UPI002622E8F5|nr:AraC family transcriptional regulator [uncultured Psychroserpens sp.]
MDFRIQKTLNYIEDNLDKHFALNELAQYACLSPSQFHRIFKKETNRTPHKFIEHIKMNTAYQAIINERISIQDLSIKMGYNNYETFTRAFKKYFHFSPDDLRSIVINIKSNINSSESEKVIIATIDKDDTDVNEIELIKSLQKIMTDKKISGLDLKDATIYKVVKIDGSEKMEQNLVKNKYEIINEKRIWKILISTNNY